MADYKMHSTNILEISKLYLSITMIAREARICIQYFFRKTYQLE